MGTSLTGTKPKDTYDSLIKVGDNGPISGTAKYLSDGLGNDLPISVSTSNVGIGTSNPAQRLDIAAGALIADRLNSDLTCSDGQGLVYVRTNNIGSIDGLRYASRSHRFVSHANALYATIDVDGLKFGSDTAAANALNDYEEGTWTMGITFGGGSTGIGYANNTGTYTKIGRQVSVNGLITLSSNGSSTGVVRITGLPFTIGGSVANYGTPSLWLQNVSYTGQFQALGIVGTTFIEVSQITEAGAFTLLTNSNFGASVQIAINFTYFV